MLLICIEKHISIIVEISTSFIAHDYSRKHLTAFCCHSIIIPKPATNTKIPWKTVCTLLFLATHIFRGAGARPFPIALSTSFLSTFFSLEHYFACSATLSTSSHFGQHLSNISHFERISSNKKSAIIKFHSYLD